MDDMTKKFSEYAAANTSRIDALTAQLESTTRELETARNRAEELSKENTELTLRMMGLQFSHSSLQQENDTLETKVAAYKAAELSAKAASVQSAITSGFALAAITEEMKRRQSVIGPALAGMQAAIPKEGEEDAGNQGEGGPSTTD
jgi:chromosome segregation ATPase